MAAFSYGSMLVFMATGQLGYGSEAVGSPVMPVVVLCMLLAPAVLWHAPKMLAACVAGQHLALVCSVMVGVTTTISDLWPILGVQAALAIVALTALSKERWVVTELLHQQQALRRRELVLEERAAASDRYRAEFLATACHDLRQPANALALFVEELAHADPGAASELLLGRVRTASRNLNAALSVLTEIAMADAGRGILRREAIDIARIVETVRSTYSLVADSKGLQLKVSLIAEQGLGDPAVFQSILANLVANAVKYTDRGSVHILTAVRGTQVDVVVQDTGRGIPTSDQARLYEEFFRGSNVGPRETGMGLGLALVRRLVTRADWRIELTSVVGEGTRVTLTMPLAMASNVMPKAVHFRHPIEQGNVLAGCRIIIVEDDIFVASSMRRTMEQWGALVHEAHSIEEMMHLIDDSLCKPDVVVVDHRLSDSGSGFDAVERLRGHAATAVTPVLMVTGDLDASVREHAERIGVGLMHKPLSVLALNRALQKLSGTAQRTSPLQEVAPSGTRLAEKMLS